MRSRSMVELIQGILAPKLGLVCTFPERRVVLLHDSVIRIVSVEVLKLSWRP